MTLDQAFELGIIQSVLFNVQVEEEANYPVNIKLHGRDVLGKTYDFSVPVMHSPQDINIEATIEQIKTILVFEGLSQFDLMSFMYVDEGNYIKEFLNIEEMVHMMLGD